MKDKTTNLEQFSKAVNDVGKSKSEGSTIDHTIFRKTVVFSVTKCLPDSGKEGVGIPQQSVLRPADRISTLLVSLTMQNVEGLFESWDRFDTKYKTVNLGDISRSQRMTGEVSGSMGPAAQGRIPAKIEGKLTTEESLSENLHLSKQYIEISGEISKEKQEATLFLEGASDIDLAGTFSVDFDIRTKGDKIKIVKVGSLRQGNQAVTSDNIQLGICELIYPTSTSPIRCNLDYQYVLRKVTGKDREIAEGYHRVKFLKKSKHEGPFTLVSRKELSNPIYLIISPNGRLSIEGQQIVLGFITYEEAKNFIIWLKETKALKIGTSALKVGPRYLEEKDIDRLVIDYNEASELKNLGKKK